MSRQYFGFSCQETYSATFILVDRKSDGSDEARLNFEFDPNLSCDKLLSITVTDRQDGKEMCLSLDPYEAQNVFNMFKSAIESCHELNESNE